MFRKTTLFCMIIVISLLCISDALALSVKTHRVINEYIATNQMGNGLLLDSILKNKFGFQWGIVEKIEDKDKNSKFIFQFISDGGWYEDKPPEWYSIDWTYLRAFNHFYTPTTNSGLSGGPYDSTLSWALRPLGEQVPYGHYSWFDVRNYFSLALTAETKADREANYANMFRGLGQLMHLVSDMSVPEHTRHDIHILDIDYENYVTNHIGEILFPTAPDPDNPGFTLQFKPKFFGGALTESIAPLFDSGQFDGTNPGVTINSNIGLAEFSNANFLSDESIFVGYMYPKIDNLEIWTDPGVKNRRYAWKRGEGAAVKHLVALGASAIDRKRIFPQDSNNEILVELDDAVYKDYADILIPRAVGYSADMLRYFFRGDISLVSGEDVIQNNSGEDLNGVFTAYYDDASGNRYSAGVVFSGTITKNGGKSPKISIETPTEHTPAEPGKYMLVFKGAIGAETGAVAASIITVNQPSYVFIIQKTAEWNSTPVETSFTKPEYTTVKKVMQWDARRQKLTGIFKAFKDIKKIEVLLSNQSMASYVRLLIDGQLVNGTVWQREANMTGNPKNWTLEEELNGFYISLQGAKLKVTLSDENVFETGLITLGGAFNETKNSAYSTDCARNFFVHNRTANLSIYGVPWQKFKLINFGGQTSFINRHNSDCYNLDYFWLHQGGDYYSLQITRVTYIGNMYYPPYEYPFTNFYALALEPYLEFAPTATLERDYSAFEKTNLKAIGVSPEPYKIELR